MRKRIVIVVILAAVAIGGGAWYYRANGGNAAAASPNPPVGGGPGGRGGAGGRAPMPVDMAPATRHEVIDYITVVGNLIGQATVDVVPRVGGRIESIPVKLGDRVNRGQVVAKIEDDQIREQ